MLTLASPLLITIVSWFLAVVGIGGVVAGIWTDGLWFIAVTPFVFIIVFVAPYRLFKKVDEELTVLKTRRLTVRVGQSKRTKEGPIYHHLTVHNETAQHISACYGKLSCFWCGQDTDADQNFPHLGVGIPWQTWGSAQAYLSGIGAHDSNMLDFAYAINEQADEFVIAPVLLEGKQRHPLFVLRRGIYFARIKVGSENMDFLPTEETFRIEFRGGLDL